MTALQRYYQRAPRYILLPQDDCLIRVAGPKQTPWEEGTQVLNISGSGLAFTAPNYLAPQVGEHIKIQYLVPGAGQMACFAQVVRKDPWSTDSMMVAVKYEYMDLTQQVYLRQGLMKKIKDQQAKENAMEKDTTYWLLRFTLVSNIFLTAMILFGLYYFMNRYTWPQLANLLTHIF